MILNATGMIPIIYLAAFMIAFIIHQKVTRAMFNRYRDTRRLNNCYFDSNGNLAAGGTIR